MNYHSSRAPAKRFPSFLPEKRLEMTSTLETTTMAQTTTSKVEDLLVLSSVSKRHHPHGHLLAGRLFAGTSRGCATATSSSTAAAVAATIANITGVFLEVPEVGNANHWYKPHEVSAGQHHLKQTPKTALLLALLGECR
jgi:hypothetical protein